MSLVSASPKDTMDTWRSICLVLLGLVFALPWWRRQTSDEYRDDGPSNGGSTLAHFFKRPQSWPEYIFFQPTTWGFNKHSLFKSNSSNISWKIKTDKTVYKILCFPALSSQEGDLLLTSDWPLLVMLKPSVWCKSEKSNIWWLLMPLLQEIILFAIS